MEKERFNLYITYDEAYESAMKFDRHKKNHKNTASCEKGGSSKFKDSHVGETKRETNLKTPNTRSTEVDKENQVASSAGDFFKIKCFKCQGGKHYKMDYLNLRACKIMEIQAIHIRSFTEDEDDKEELDMDEGGIDEEARFVF